MPKPKTTTDPKQANWPAFHAMIARLAPVIRKREEEAAKAKESKAA